MQSQFDIVSCPTPTPTPPPAGPTPEVADLLRQLIDVQREQLAQMQATAAAHDTSARWRALVARWKQEFPELPDACRQALPTLERAYGAVIVALTEELKQNGPDALESEYTLQDFLDRYGMRLGQLGNILNLVAPLAESAPQNESPGAS
jgi:hypothetical protein